MERRRHQGIIVSRRVLHKLLPAFRRTAEINVGQGRAVPKGSPEDPVQSPGETDLLQMVTPAEREGLEPVHAVRQGHGGQTGAGEKRFLRYDLHPLRDPDRSQGPASGKDAVSQSLHAVRDPDAGQAAAVLKQPKGQRGQPIGQSHLSEGGTSGKGLAADFGHAVRQPDLCQAGTAGKGPPIQNGNALRHVDAPLPAGGTVQQPGPRPVIQDSVLHREAGVARLHGQRLQPGAVGKGPIPDLRYRSRNLQGSETGAAGQSLGADNGHPARDPKGRHALAAEKGSVPNLGDPLGKVDLPQ